MNIKPKDIIILLVIMISVTLIVHFLSPTIATLKQPKISTILKEKVDTVLIRDPLYYEALTHNYLIRVEITPFVKYRSSSDTTVTVRDTLGKIIIPLIRFKDLVIADQYRIKEILIMHK